MSTAENPTSHRREELMSSSHLITPAQLRILALLDKHGPLQVSSRTDEASRRVHRAAADALVRAGICSVRIWTGVQLLQRLPEFDAHQGDGHSVSYTGEARGYDEGPKRLRDFRNGECQRCHVTWTEYRN